MLQWYKCGAAYRSLIKFGFESIKKTKKEVSTISVLQSVLPIKWALMDQALGIDRTSGGHSLPVRCAQSAQTLGNFWAPLTGRRLCYYA